jgi:hypothetical protein
MLGRWKLTESDMDWDWAERDWMFESFDQTHLESWQNSPPPLSGEQRARPTCVAGARGRERRVARGAACVESHLPSLGASRSLPCCSARNPPPLLSGEQRARPTCVAGARGRVRRVAPTTRTGTGSTRERTIIVFRGVRAQARLTYHELDAHRAHALLLPARANLRLFRSVRGEPGDISRATRAQSCKNELPEIKNRASSAGMSTVDQARLTSYTLTVLQKRASRDQEPRIKRRMSTVDKVAARKEYDKLEHEGEACTSAHLYLARCAALLGRAANQTPRASRYIYVIWCGGRIALPRA